MDAYSECLKLVVDLESMRPIASMEEVPSTFNPGVQQFVWKHYQGADYAVIPREIHAGVARVDLFIEMDEDDLDDIDVPRFVREFLNTEVLSNAPRFVVKWISEPEEWNVPVEVRHIGANSK